MKRKGKNRSVVLQKPSISKNFRTRGTFGIVPLTLLLHFFCLKDYWLVAAFMNA